MSVIRRRGRKTVLRLCGSWVLLRGKLAQDQLVVLQLTDTANVAAAAPLYNDCDDDYYGHRCSTTTATTTAGTGSTISTVDGISPAIPILKKYTIIPIV